MSAVNFPENKQPVVASQKRNVRFASETIVHRLPERDALFAHMTLTRQVKHLLEMSPLLTPFLDKLLKSTMPSEVKMAEMGVIEAYFEQNRSLEHPSFLNDFVEQGGDLSSLLFDFLGETSEARQSAVLAIAHHLNLRDVTDAVKNRMVMRLLRHPIHIHPSLKYMLDGYENPKRACIDALFQLPARVDAHFFPLPDLLNLLLQTLCNGYISLEECQIPVSEMHIDSMSELLLYLLRLHDANFGENKKGSFIGVMIDHLRAHISKLPESLFDELSSQLYQRLWFEERKEGVVKPFLMMDGHYCGLPTISALQNAFSLLAIESKHCKNLDLLRNYIMSDAFADFLRSYAMVHNPHTIEEGLTLQGTAEASPETLASYLQVDLKMHDFCSFNVMSFLHRLNRLVLESRSSKLLFVNKFVFSRAEASLFTLSREGFHSAVMRKLYLPLKSMVTDHVLLEKKVLRSIFKNLSFSDSYIGTPFEIAKAFAGPSADLLPYMQAIERHIHLPITLAIGRLRDGSRLVCQMDYLQEKPKLMQMTEEELIPLDFEDFRFMRVGELTK